MFNKDFSKKDKADAKKYGNELGLSILIYVLVLFVSIYFAKKIEDEFTRIFVVLTPTIPALGAFWAIIRHFQRMDEYLRVWVLEVVAIAGGITAFFSFSYGFLEGIGYPKLSGFVLYGIFMMSWLLISTVRKLLLEREA